MRIQREPSLQTLMFYAVSMLAWGSFAHAPASQLGLGGHRVDVIWVSSHEAPVFNPFCALPAGLFVYVSVVSGGSHSLCFKQV